ncbi:MAG: hypothetical protein HRT89_08905, partial [Lentisphaeria bacterium]|nr:hypothetical protein [Lentisphaeria bacterium]
MSEDNHTIEERAIDGMLQEYARAGEGSDESFITSVMDGIETESEFEIEPKLNFFFNRKVLFSAAALFLFSALVIFTDNRSLLNGHAATTQAVLYCNNELAPGTTAAFRVSIRNDQKKEAINNAAVSLYLKPEKGKRILIGKDKTGSSGFAVISANIPADLDEGKYTVVAETTYDKKAVVNVSKTIHVKRSYKCMLSSDKPM